MFLKSLFFYFVMFLSTTQSGVAKPQKLFASVPSEGVINAKLHPGPSIKLGKLTRVSFGIPFPKNVLLDAKFIKIVVNGQQVPSSSIETTRWHSIKKSKRASIRSVLVNTDIVFVDYKPLNFSIEYGKQTEKSLNLMDVDTQPRKQWVNVVNDQYPAAEGITEPAVYVTLPPEWLSQCLLKSRFHKVGEANKWRWFDRFFEKYAKTAVNDVSKSVADSEKINFISQSEPWLFDRASVLYSIYLRTGKVQWLRHAHRAALFYAKHIDQSGYFDLKKMDAKYSYGQSLLLDLVLMGDMTHLPIIERIAVVGKKWPVDYKLTHRFWTERHMAFAILATLAALEATGDKKYFDHLEKIMASLTKMANNPLNGWKPNYCFLHTMQQHEGCCDDKPVCSPWMSALLSDAIWKYFLYTENTELLKMIAGLGDFVAEYGSYIPENPKFKYVVPWYLASSEKQFSDSGPFADIEHTCDVAGLLTRAAWAKKRMGKPTEVVLNKVNAYLTSCEKNLNLWYRPKKNTQKPIWRLSPSRKFNWWFGTNTDMSWLMENLEATQ